MLRSLRSRRLLATLAVVATMPMVRAQAQVAHVVPALRLQQVVHVGYETRYLYHLVGPASRYDVFSDVYLEITSPKQAAPPILTGTRGEFLFDALIDHHADSTIEAGHPPLYIGSPAHWSAAVYRQGLVSWGASRWANGPNYGVRHGQDLEGFELRSPALPALRAYRVVPWRPFASADGDADAQPTDSTWVIATGVILAPGWPAEDVTASYLREQVVTACEARLVDQCGRYYRLVDAILRAEVTGADLSYLAAIREFQLAVTADRVSHAHARIVFAETATALSRRPPSRRPPASRR